MIRPLVFALAAGVGLAAVPGDLPVWARGGKAYKTLVEQKMNAPAGNSTPNFFSQSVDHFNASKGTFLQKYFVDASYATNNDVALLYISGEGPCESSPVGAIQELADQLGAFLIALEHRWYGDSLPGSILSTEDLLTLSVDQVMEDVRSFVAFWEKSHGKKTWGVVGGSYAGALSSWIRQKDDDIFSASWSSSGVVEAIRNYTAFDAAVVEVLPADCLASLRAVMQAAETAWQSPASKSRMLSLFGTPADFTETDFMWLLADSAAMGVQYGFKDDMCSAMVPQPQDALAGFAKWTLNHYGSDFGSSCYYSTACLSDPTRYEQWYNAKTWVFQCCSEVEFWQVAYEGSLRSSLITLDYFDNQCSVAFGANLPRANVTAFNEKYGGNSPPTTHVAASQGSDDPWRTAGVSKSLNPLYQEFTATCDGCGHCKDLHVPQDNDPDTIVEQRQAIMEAFSQYMSA